ncbi:glycosyltransferase [Conexibacter sp. CPCC 206217]|nr:macrolide family glycosyltransferase [Conexibacter sp. CPCC 206217]MDO8210537.1 glycosyltransferase [Conexibacter sp. CPCC 206217]
MGAYHARVLAHRWGVPAVQLSPTYVAWEGYEQDMAEALAPVRALDGYDEYTARFADWLARDGITLSVDEFVGRPPRCLALIPRALQPNADRVDATRYTFVGATVDAGRDEAAWEGPADGSRVLLISLGSAFTEQPAFYRACLEAFGGLDGWHVVLSIGRYVEPAELGELPANVELHRFVPQLAVLAQAGAFVTHAGMGSAKEALAAGVPMIALPQAVDQFPNAARLVELGVARQLATAEATPQDLRAALQELTDDPQVRARAAQLRGEIAREGGAARAADLIEAEVS